MDEFKSRLNAAKAERKTLVEGVGREIYKFCFNGREAEWDSGKRARQTEPEEIFTDAPATIAEEFHGELFSTMTPENAPWVEYEAGSSVDEDQVPEAEEQLRLYETNLDRAIRASNYYDEGQTAFQDAVVGTVAMWIDRPTLSGPASCEAVPISQLYLRLDPFGIADRFREQSYFTRDLMALFPDAKWPTKLKAKIKNAKGETSKVVWGFWPTYDDPANPVWVEQVRVDGEDIGLDEKIGEAGAVPLVVGRFNPVALSPWGRGPGWRMLPTIRVLNSVAEMTLEGMDRNLDPAWVYPHDGMTDLSDGIEPGLGYPSMPGSADSIRPIGLVDNLDQGFFTEERLEMSLRYGFYREIEQRGKTPPSASQYIGQEQKQLRRIARPAAKLWREFGVGLLKRFEHLERQPGGSLEDVRLPLLESGVVSARPISPLERAQAREDVLIAESIIDMTVKGLGPEQAALLIDGPKTYRGIKGTLKDRIVEFRTEQQMMEIMQAMQAAQGGSVEGGEREVP